MGDTALCQRAGRTGCQNAVKSVYGSVLVSSKCCKTFSKEGIDNVLSQVEPVVDDGIDVLPLTHFTVAGDFGGGA